MSNLSSIRRCIENDDFRNFLKILKRKKIDLNSIDYYGFSIIHWIAYFNRTDFFEKLEESRYMINYSIRSQSIIGSGDSHKQSDTTPLICSSEQVNVEMVKYLLRKGVDVNEVDSSGASSLLRVTQQLIKKIDVINNLDKCYIIMELLLSYGADVENSEYCNTPLCISVGFNNIKPIQLLLKYNAKIDSLNMIMGEENVTPIYAICNMKNFSKHKLDELDEEIKKSLRNFIDKNGTSKFPPDVEIVRLFMDYNPEYFKKLFTKEKSLLTKQEKVIIQFIDFYIFKGRGEGLGEDSDIVQVVEDKIVEEVDIKGEGEVEEGDVEGEV